MSEVASRELRNDTAGVLRRWLPRSELTRRLRVAQADPGLRDDLASLAGDTTDQLGPIH